LNTVDARPDLSIVVPVFNGAATLRELLDGILNHVKSSSTSLEVLFVDDGSTDDSWDVIQALHADHGGLVRGYRLARNSGQQSATYCGILRASGEWVATIDDDLQQHPGDVVKLWDHARTTKSDVVYGVFTTVRQGLIHRLGARLFRKLLRRVAPHFPDGSSFRIINSEVVKALPRQVGPWVLVDPMLAWHSSSIATIEVSHEKSRAVRSRYSVYMLCAIACRLLLTYSVIPLRVVTMLGLFSSMMSFGIGLYYFIRKITVGGQLGFSAIIVSVAFFSGMILLNLGILGEYIARIHTMGSREPAFSIRSEI